MLLSMQWVFWLFVYILNLIKFSTFIFHIFNLIIWHRHVDFKSIQIIYRAWNKIELLRLNIISFHFLNLVHMNFEYFTNDISLEMNEEKYFFLKGRVIIKVWLLSKYYSLLSSKNWRYWMKFGSTWNYPELEEKSTELVYKIDESLRIQRMWKQVAFLTCRYLLLSGSERYM